jgi:hypothetical protein
MTTYTKALDLAHQQNYGELFEFLSGKISEERLMHIYAMAQSEMALEVNTSSAQFDIVHMIQTHILN